MADQHRDKETKYLRIGEELRKSDTKNIKVAVTDIDGILRGKYLIKDKFLSALETGFGVCNVVFGWDMRDVCYDNTTYTGWHSGYPDALVMPDPSTYRKIPWEGGLPFFLGEFVDEQKMPLEVCPRQVLKKVMKKLEAFDFSAKCGFEFEWFNFRESPQSLLQKEFKPEPITPGMFGYSILRTALNQPYFTALTEELQSFGIPLEGLHTETGPGAFEAAICYSDALEAADRAVLFKTSVKQIAYRFGILPSFMAKWNTRLPGCSGHIHLSLWDKAGSQNLFHAEKEYAHMSALQKHFLAGQMHCLIDLLPLYAPNINSYKRLVEGFWAPTKVTWGVDNRTTAFRVIPGGKSSARIETRVSGSDVNPYLALAAALGSGLYGVERKLELSEPPVKGSAYHERNNARQLPRTLGEATQRMAESPVAREIFGDKFVDHYVQTRVWESRQFYDAVTNWELERYFELC